MLERPNTLRRSDVMLNSFGSCISDAPKESTFAPEMPFSEIISQPRMLLQEFESRVPFEKLQCFTNRHCWRQFNKQMDVVNSDMKFIDFTSMSDCNFVDESFAINSDSKKFKWVPSILGFPDKMLSILPNCMFEMFQIHFFPPKLKQENIAHANFVYLFQEPNIRALHINNLTKLNFMEKGSPPKLESKGIRAFTM